MPGRHASGPLGGGFGSGGSGGFPGGGWRPRGPWNPQGPVPMFGGGGLGLLGWLPLLFFRPRFGRGGGGCGLGCLPLLCILLACICLFSGGGFGSRSFYYSGQPYPVNVNPVNVNPGNSVGSTNSGSSTGLLSDEPPAVQTQTAKDMAQLHTAFDSRIADWQNVVNNNEALSVPPADAGLSQDNNTKEVLYGKCGSALYVYVVAVTKPDVTNADGEGYAYTTASSPGACHPAQWTVVQSEDVGGNWYFVLLKSTR